MAYILTTWEDMKKRSVYSDASMKEQPALLINIDVYYLNFDSKLSQKLGVDVLFKTTNYMSLCSLLYRLYITA